MDNRSNPSILSDAERVALVQNQIKNTISKHNVINYWNCGVFDDLAVFRNHIFNR